MSDLLTLLISSERLERISHGRSFSLSDLSDSLTVAHLSWAIWVNEQWANERIPSPASTPFPPPAPKPVCLDLQSLVAVSFFICRMCGEKGVYCTLGWSDFEKYKKLHILCCAKLLKDPNSKISVLYVASFLGRRASENLECYPKMSKKKKKYCQRLHLKQNLFLLLV